ncbi:hypothetical protein quinque_002419 [Culex quinquefasciatus]
MSVAQVSKCRSVGLEADSTRINKEVIVLKGKSVEKLIASGCEKLSSGGAVPAAATEEKKADKKIEGSGFEDDMDCGLFEQGNIPRDHIPGAASVTASFGPRRHHFRRVVKDHDGGNSEIAESMKTMQNDIANLTSTITDLKEKVQTQSTSLSTPSWPNKRQRGSSTDTPVKVAIPTAFRGTKAMNSVPVIAAEPNDLWYLWLSSFPPSMLVKKGVDVSTLSSVTFKVGIGRDYRESSMDAANWPEGLSFREFVDIDRRPAPTVLPSGISRRRLE